MVVEIHYSNGQIVLPQHGDCLVFEEGKLKNLRDGRTDFCLVDRIDKEVIEDDDIE